MDILPTSTPDALQAITRDALRVSERVLAVVNRTGADPRKLKLELTESTFLDNVPDTIVALGQGLGLTVIAEGVETEAQRQFFAVQGCHAYQGHLFGRAMPKEEFRLLSIWNHGALRGAHVQRPPIV